MNNINNQTLFTSPEEYSYKFSVCPNCSTLLGFKIPSGNLKNKITYVCDECETEFD